jgi:hypothetical protein
MFGEIKLWADDKKAWEDREAFKIYGVDRENLFKQAEDISNRLGTEVRLEINRSGQGHYIGTEHKFNKIYNR